MLKRIVCFEEEVPSYASPMEHYERPLYRKKIKFNELNFGFDEFGYRAPLRYATRKPVFVKPKSLLNSKGQFLVELTEKNVYLPKLVGKAQDLGLTVSGDGASPVGEHLGDIKNAKRGDLVTFGTSSRFDVNWIRRQEYALEKGYAPIYDVVDDWTKVNKAMKEFANKGKSLTLSSGGKVTFHHRFVKVGLDVYPYGDFKVVYINNSEIRNMCNLLIE